MGLRKVQNFSTNPVIPARLNPSNGGVGATNKIMWSSFFTFNAATIPQNGNFQATTTVNQEAGFLWRYMMISIYETAIDGAPILISGANIPMTLNYTLTDPQSSRTYHSVPETFNGYDPNYPYYLSSPIFMLPNYALQSNFSYGVGLPAGLTPVLSLFGYRVRLPDQLKNASLMQTPGE